MTLNASLRNRVRRLEARAEDPAAKVIGVLLRPGTDLRSACDRIRSAAERAPLVYIANLARLRLPKE